MLMRLSIFRSRFMLAMLFAISTLALAAQARAQDETGTAPVADEAVIENAVSTPPDFDRWYSIYIRDQKAGYAHLFQRTNDDGTIATSSDMKFTVSRARFTTEMRMTTVHTESADHEMLRVEYTQALGTDMSVALEYRFEGDTIVKISRHIGSETEIRRPGFNIPYLSPVEARIHAVSQIDAGEKEFRFVTLDASSGLRQIETVTTIDGPAKVRVYGREIVALKARSITSAAPGLEVTEFLDEQGVALRTDMTLGAMPFRLVAETEEDALRANENGSPEIFTPTLVKVEPAIESPRDVREGVYLLEVSKGELPDLHTGGVHHFERLSKTTGRVRIGLNDSAPAPIAETADPVFLRATPTANSEDTLILQMARTALLKAPDDRTKRAEALRSYVYKFIESKNLGTGFATASEVCRTAQGDCTEHAVLLAALLRAERIPSRVITGLIYADSFAGKDSVFGFHMWTQALLPVDGKPTWVDLDAVLPEGRTMDGAHIAVAPYNLSDDDFATSMMPVISLLGTLSIEAESVSHD